MQKLNPIVSLLGHLLIFKGFVFTIKHFSGLAVYFIVFHRPAVLGIERSKFAASIRKQISY